MIIQIFSIYDKVAQESGPLFLAKNLAVAKRMAHGNLKNVEKSDFYLRSHGDFNVETGEITVQTIVDYDIEEAPNA